MRRLPTLVSVIALLVSITSSGTAQARPLDDISPLVPESTIPPIAQRIDSTLRGRTGQVGVVVELADRSAVELSSAVRARGASTEAATSAMQQRITRIDQAQRRVLAGIQATNATVLYRTQRVYNGIAMWVDASQLPMIAAQPGVKAIHQLVPKTIDNASSVPLIGAPELWNSAGLNLTGTGIRIAIIDTGIDYLHTDFAGSGLEADYDRNDGTVITEEPKLFPTPKVAGGWDFAGDAYNGNNAPAPDPDPMDCNGHGSHVAGTAAGFGVNADGTTYSGAYGPGTDFAGMRIGPGVAPGALLYGLRVFGCGGSTNLVMEALEWAVDPDKNGDTSDRMHVVNMSLGSDFGGAYDADSVASDAVVAAGVIVVTAAGNAGDTYNVSGSPANSVKSLSVASSVDSTDVLDAFMVNAPGAITGLKEASRSVNFAWLSPPVSSPLPVTADLYYPTTNQSGCAAWTGADLSNIAGKIVLVDWRTVGQADSPCGSATRSNNAANAGAKGIIMADRTVTFEVAISGNALIPAMYTIKSVGDQLKAQLAIPAAVSITMSAAYINAGKFVYPNQTDTLSSFSSRGPGIGTTLKPDIAAPGQGIFSVAALSGSQGENISGTSMATPHMAGSMALLRQLHPDWSVQELKALAMNTANQSVRSAIASDAPIFGPSRVGSGRVNLVNAAEQSVLVYNTENPDAVSLSFGTVEVTSTLTLSKQVSLENKGAGAVTYDLAYLATSEVPGVSYSIEPAQVTIAVSSTAQITVSLTANASQMRHTHDPTISEEQVGEPRHWISEAQGYITFATVGAPTPELRLSVYAAPRPVSDMAATASLLNANTITLTGAGVNTGDTTPNDIKSLVSAYELQYQRTAIDLADTLTVAAQLQYVGVNSTYATSTITDTEIYFGLSTFGAWQTPNQVEFDIYIDTNRNGEPDYVLYNTNLPSGQDATDVFVSRLVRLANSAASYQDYINFVDAATLDTVPFNTNVMALGVFAADLGITSANPRFDYYVEAYSISAPDAVVRTPIMTYNLAQPGVAITGGLGGMPVFYDQPGATLAVAYNNRNWFNGSTRGVLLLHHHNRAGQRAEAVRMMNMLALPFVDN